MFKTFCSEFRLYLCNEWINKLPSHKIRRFYYKTVMGFHIGDTSSVFMHCTFDSAQNFKVGNYTVINPKCRLDTRGGITIGNSVSISQDVTILTADHDMDTPDFKGRTKPVTIGDYAWIGTRAMILPGISIGYGAVIAAGAIVTKDVLPFSVVAGVPAKLIGKRSENLSYEFIYERLFQ